MFEFLLSAWHPISTFIGESVALLSILAAVAVYMYGVLDPRVPKFIITPICFMLIYYGAYTFGDIEGAKRERDICAAKSIAELDKLTSQYMKSSLLLKHTLQEYESLQSDYKNLANSEQSKFNSLLESLVKKPEGTANELEVPQTSNACLPLRVPSSVVQSINEAISKSKH